jgi:hypothetical protein
MLGVGERRESGMEGRNGMNGMESCERGWGAGWGGLDSFSLSLSLEG